MNRQEFNREIEGADQQKLADLLWQARWHIAVLKKKGAWWDDLVVAAEANMDKNALKAADWDSLFGEGQREKWAKLPAVAARGYSFVAFGIGAFDTPEALAKALREERGVKQ